jgi:hypothetical protein
VRDLDDAASKCAVGGRGQSWRTLGIAKSMDEDISQGFSALCPEFDISKLEDDIGLHQTLPGHSKIPAAGNKSYFQTILPSLATTLHHFS